MSDELGQAYTKYITDDLRKRFGESFKPVTTARLREIAKESLSSLYGDVSIDVDMDHPDTMIITITPPPLLIQTFTLTLDLSDEAPVEGTNAAVTKTYDTVCQYELIPGEAIHSVFCLHCCMTNIYSGDDHAKPCLNCGTDTKLMDRVYDYE